MELNNTKVSKLKSTYRPAAQPPAPPPPTPLPRGWTEHPGSDGIPWYHHSETGYSTYTRPTTLHLPKSNAAWQWREQFDQQPGQNQERVGLLPLAGFGREPGGNGARFESGNRGDINDRTNRGALRHRDRPKHKYDLPNCQPWVLVKTKLGRRFVHNTETKESLWKAPDYVERAIIQFDLRQKRHEERRARGEPSDTEDEVVQKSTATAQVEEEESEYEEVEVTDSEADQDGDANGEPLSKRQRAEEAEPQGPIEFGEADIAYQLEAMEEDYGLDPGEYGDAGYDDAEGEDGGLPLTAAEQEATFRSLLEDYNISPYGAWERIIEESPIVDDERYTMLPNMKSRRECFKAWARDKVQELKEQKKNAPTVDPKEIFLEFLKEKANPKLYWPEFRRKFKKEPAMNDRKLHDRDREKIYRDYVRSLKK